MDKKDKIVLEVLKLASRETAYMKMVQGKSKLETLDKYANKTQQMFGKFVEDFKNDLDKKTMMAIADVFLFDFID